MENIWRQIWEKSKYNGKINSMFIGWLSWGSLKKEKKTLNIEERKEIVAGVILLSKRESILVRKKYAHMIVAKKHFSFLIIK